MRFLVWQFAEIQTACFQILIYILATKSSPRDVLKQRFLSLLSDIQNQSCISDISKHNHHPDDCDVRTSQKIILLPHHCHPHYQCHHCHNMLDYSLNLYNLIWETQILFRIWTLKLANNVCRVVDQRAKGPKGFLVHPSPDSLWSI